MQWSEFNPYVAPYVIGCPDPLIEQHARLAAIEFCRRTSCWQKTLDPVVTDGVSNLVELENETGLQIIKIKAVSVDGRSHPVTDSSNGLKLARSGSTQNYCFTQDNKTLHISPLQVSGIAVQVDAVLAPSRTAATLDDVIGAEYLHDIALGAITSLMRLPKQPWTDYNAAGIYSTQFTSRIATVAAKVSRGFMAQKMRSHASYL